jgi:DNA repair exonuclease SbcCD nuclease subunit
MPKFIHTADWQIGKPFARVADAGKLARLRHERIEAITRIGAVVRDKEAAFVLVAGDLFDSTTPEKSTVSAACAAIGSIGVPVLAIPGNHDHAGPGSIWEQEFFKREQQTLAPNFRLLATPEPVEVCGVVILPCPLLRKQETGDTTAWLRNEAAWTAAAVDMPRVLLAHGSVQGFSSVSDGEESSGQPNLIDLSTLTSATFDYIALGDWHGTKQVSPNAWYSGTPELDRFLKGEKHNPGNVLCVDLVARGQVPTVTMVRTAHFGWHDETFLLVDDDSLTHLEQRLVDVLGPRAQEDLLRLVVEGPLGLAGDNRLKQIIESLEARLLRLKLENNVQVIPSEEELAQLTGRAGDPLISAVSARLVEQQNQGGESAAVARRALRELYVAVQQDGGRA